MRRAARGPGALLMYETFARTKSVCPVCLRTIDAEKAVAGDGFVHLIKTCPEHGFFDALIWEGGAEEYLAWGGAPAGGGADDGCPNNCGLCGGHKSVGCCVLLELTPRCNLRCPVCFASAGGEGDLGLDEIARLYDMLMARGGPFNIQLSGNPSEEQLQNLEERIMEIARRMFEQLQDEDSSVEALQASLL